jgi:hypothetical protein
VNHTLKTPTARRASRAATTVAALGLLGSVLLLAGPAQAVPEGWSNPEEVDTLYALGLLVGLPALLFLLISLAVYVPSLARGAVAAASGPEHEWFGGPRKAMDELAGPDGEDSKAGGASGRW